MPVTLIGESVFARCLSSLKNERVDASKLLRGPTDTRFEGNKEAFIEEIRKVRIEFGKFTNHSSPNYYRLCMLRRLCPMLKVSCYFEKRLQSLTGS